MSGNNELNYITENITTAAKEVFGKKLRTVILYGSYARGDNDNESDIDIILIVDIPSSKISHYQDIISLISSDLSLETEDCVTISAFVQDNETFSRYGDVLPFYKNVLAEGIVLYAA